MGRDIIYVELSKAKVQDRRNIVISECSKGGFTIAQQLEVNEGDRKTSVFLKGAFHVDNVNGLINLRDAINVAIMESEKYKDGNNVAEDEGKCEEDNHCSGDSCDIDEVWDA